jgi:hypothetical protein
MLQAAPKHLLEYTSAASKNYSGPVRTVTLHIASSASIGYTQACLYVSLPSFTALTYSVDVLLANSNSSRPVQNSRKRKRSTIPSGCLLSCLLQLRKWFSLPKYFLSTVLVLSCASYTYPSTSTWPRSGCLRTTKYPMRQSQFTEESR